MSQPGYPGKQRIVDINGSGGAFVSILATTTCRRLIIEESPLTAAGGANTLQGALQYKLPNDSTTNGFTTTFEALGANTDTTVDNPTVARIEIPDKAAQIASYGLIIGQLGQPIVGLPGAVPAATTMIQLRSGTATGTSVTVTEYN